MMRGAVVVVAGSLMALGVWWWRGTSEAPLATPSTSEQTVAAAPDAPAAPEAASDTAAATGAPEPEAPETDETEADATDPASEPATQDTAAETGDTGSADDATATDAAATADAQELRSEATFDLVRIEPGGSALIAGRGVPGAVVRLYLDGVETTEATADRTGSFVLFADLGPSDDPRVLTVTETLADGAVLADGASLILAPVAPLEVAAAGPGAGTASDTGATSEAEVAPEPAVTEPAELIAAAAPEAATDAAERTGEAGLGEVPEIAALSPAPEAAPEPEAPTVLVSDEEGVRVVQQGGTPPRASNVSIDAITYDDAGEVALTGRGIGAESVRIYLNNRPLLDADIGTDGQWRADLPQIDSGTYTLRVDEIGAGGEVVSRAETPFRREPAQSIRDLAGGSAGEGGDAAQVASVSLITVQPGNTLWGIARDKYGEGMLFVRVFEANTDRIRNPDLIYPGQIFSVPD